jgi:hypothetical protein
MLCIVGLTEASCHTLGPETTKNVVLGNEKLTVHVRTVANQSLPLSFQVTDALVDTATNILPASAVNAVTSCCSEMMQRQFKQDRSLGMPVGSLMQSRLCPGKHAAHDS